MTDASGATRGRRYRDSRRRLLLDMHIPDWDDRFLSAYDPQVYVQAVLESGADGAMLYFQSHLGLCYWPTRSGKVHRAARSRDLAGEALAGLNQAGLPVCAYYSVNFNNQAWLDHPDWRLKPASPATIGQLPRARYGIVCLNNPDYRAFVDAQIDEVAAYPVDAFFFDMVWWNGVCVCDSCRSRFLCETGEAIPDTIDWLEPGWVRFQATRERWLAEFTTALRDRARAGRPDAEVYHNFALGLSNWTRGVSFDSVAGHDFLGGDFYGGRAEQLLISRLMLNLTPSRPAEFMTTVAAGLTEHTRLRPQAELTTKALAATASGAAFLAIVAIDPDGRIEPEAIARVRVAFDAARAFAPYLGGAPVEDVGVYCSDHSKMSFAENGRTITASPGASLPDYPHFKALTGACRILQQAHLAFGVVTRANLGELARWPVLVLPNVTRMSRDEVEAFRSYVAQGGRLYASRETSLALDDGSRGQDFALAGLFGCHHRGEAGGRLVYARARGWHLPERPLAHWRIEGGTGATVVAADAGEVLVTLTTPYGYPEPGAVGDTRWASIHSSPPWTDTDEPLVVRNRHGDGQVIYSALDIEAGETPEHDQLLLSLIRALAPRPARLDVDTHPCVWASAFDQPEANRMTVCLLNYQLEAPAIPVATSRVSAGLPKGRRVLAVKRAPDLEAIPFEEPEPGRVSFDAGTLDLFAMFIVEHAPA